jgi:ribosomal protein S18
MARERENNREDGSAPITRAAVPGTKQRPRCPFESSGALYIDYKDTETLKR